MISSAPEYESSKKAEQGNVPGSGRGRHHPSVPPRLRIWPRRRSLHHLQGQCGSGRDVHCRPPSQDFIEPVGVDFSARPSGRHVFQ